MWKQHEYAIDHNNYVTCYEKRDHSGYFIKIEVLAWTDSSMSAESNGTSFIKEILITSALGLFRKCVFLIKVVCIQLNNSAHNYSLHVATL